MASLQAVIDDIQGGQLDIRRKAAVDYRDSFDGDLEKFLDLREGETPEDFKRRPHVWLNLTRPMIRLLSGLYKEDPERKFTPEAAEAVEGEAGGEETGGEARTGAEPWVERIEAVYTKRLQGALMKKADAMARLLGTSAIQVWYDRAKKAPKFILRTPDAFDVYSRPGHPEEAQFVVTFGVESGLKWAEIWQAPDQGDDGMPVGSVEHWRFEQEKKQGLLREVSHEPLEGYTVLPFAFFHNDLPHDEFWVPGFGPSLCEGNWHVNNVLTDLAHGMQYQSHGQWFVKNADPKWTPEVGPGKLVKIKENGELGILAPMLQVPEIRAYINDYLDDLLATHDLPKASYRLEVSGVRSGVSIIAEQQPLIDERKERGTIFSKWEENLAWVTLNVLAAEEKLSIPTDPDAMGFEIAYTEPTPQLFDADWVTRKTWEHEQGLVSRVDLYMELHPRLSREEAIEALERVDQEEDMHGKSSPVTVPELPGDEGEFGETGGGTDAEKLLEQLAGTGTGEETNTEGE